MLPLVNRLKSDRDRVKTNLLFVLYMDYNDIFWNIQKRVWFSSLLSVSSKMMEFIKHKFEELNG